ncbi:Endo-polygalacturonase/pectinesterase [Candidatus Sulfopaludibacter sp. SbA3]|nr:Endo-polygalacturonase/pectinesterase [Candidatus Sulfopaludibacter sp. SbA3]
MSTKLALALALVALPCSAQDTRRVTEPHIPPSCTVLPARLAAPNGALAEADERNPDTARIQGAIDQCRAGQAVELQPSGGKNIFLAGPLTLKAGVTLLVDGGAALFASRNPRDYDLTPGSCGVVNERGHGCKTFLTADHATGGGIMGDGAIDGRGGAKLLGQNVTWWDLAKTAKIMDQSQSVPRLIAIRQSDGFTMYRITLRNSPNFHVGVDQTNGFTAWGVKIQTPKTARNTDGIDPSSSTNVTIAYCEIATGDDNVAIKTGATGPSTHMTIAHNHFYSGHGMSIGSGTAGGVSAIRVQDLTLDGTDYGIRIKSDRSRGGVVEDVSYENVCMKDVPNPILLTPMYTTFSGNRLPVYRNILLKNVHSATPGWVTLLGLDADHKLGVTLDDVTVQGLRPDEMRVENADPHGAVQNAPASCRFTAFPALPTAPAAAVTLPPEDKTLYVAASGTGDYYSIQRAIDVTPAEGAVISIAPGTYRETLKITKPNIHLRGPYSDPSKTVIVFDNSAGSTGSTFRSATVEVSGDNFFAENLTFSNDFNRTHPQLPTGSQALAINVTGDRAVFRNVRFLGNQDTVYAARKRQYFVDCYIEGNVDFIFGDARAVFENCEIHSNRKAGGYITAQGKSDAKQDNGYVFNHCRLTAEPGVDHVWLGRPWRPYATVIFLNTEMGPFIEPEGWREWHPGETKYMETVFYAEYNSSGPGAYPGDREAHTKHLSAAEAAQYETRRYLAGTDGWDPAAVK